jgi:hypothetical protein
MTVHRRSLLLLAATAFLFPACISISANPAPITPADVAARITAEGASRATESIHTTSTDFAIYPSRPGEVVPTKPIVKATTAQKPGPMPVPPVPPAPVPPPNPFVPAGGPNPTSERDPGVFPLAAVRPPHTDLPLIMALRAHIDGKPERAFEAIAGLDRLNQEVILAILPVLTRGATANLAGDPLAAAILVEQLRAAAARLEPLAALRVDAALFCDAVYGFGRYLPRPVNQPYRPNDKAQLYLEVRNLISQPAVGPRGETYLTHARARVEVRDAYGKRVLQPHPDDYRRRIEVVEFDEKRYTRTPVQDFHVLYAFPVPAAPGVYTVTVELSDAAGRRAIKTTPVEFRVAGP